MGGSRNKGRRRGGGVLYNVTTEAVTTTEEGSIVVRAVERELRHWRGGGRGLRGDDRGLCLKADEKRQHL